MEIILIIAILIAMLLLINMRYNKKMDSFLWSIRVFSHNTFIHEVPNDSIFIKPTLQASDITDVIAELVADPFLFIEGSDYYLFFEIYNKVTEKGEIGLATSGDGENWSYQKIILTEKFHLSYPQVFKFQNEFYMIPESIGANKVLLYKAKNFPYQWEIAQELLSGKYVDPSIFQYKDKWWMFAATDGQLHLFYANNLQENWTEHKQSPLIRNNIHITRPGGRIIVDDDLIYRYTQEGLPYYGHSVSLFKITKLSEEHFEEEKVNTVLEGSNMDNDWRKDGMHHIDQIKLNDHQWLIAVDGHHIKKSHYFAWKLNRIMSKIQFSIR
ncbi:family 43 glycosylhydrolase [Bacillus sp. FJAT-28004]|uniref:glucosamine inositolphosphorylceramide transferase family protein n=1 Tax=Bacillus sp. FJAT-28004 TaxID=1679165 RepID=UPI0006B46BA0|nr:family 43 glycosylhydrolase [Bacillus sp. FJAT-28004]